MKEHERDIPRRPDSTTQNAREEETNPASGLVPGRRAGSLVPAVAKLGGSVGRVAAPAVLTAMAVASAPLSGRPKVVRDTIGWMALWTAFLSVSLWTYLLLFHKPEVPHTDSAPIEIVDSAGATKSAHPVAGAPETESPGHSQSTGGEH